MLKNKKLFSLLIVIFLGSAVVSTGFLIARYYQDRLLPGTQIGDIDVSNKTTSEAAQILENEWRSFKGLSLESVGYKKEIELTSIGVNYDIQESVSQAQVEIKRKELGKIVAQLVVKPVEQRRFDPVFTMDQNALNENVLNISTELNVPAQNPEIRFDKIGKLVSVAPGENGQEVEVELLKQRVIASIKSFTPVVSIPVRKIQPKLSDVQAENAKARVTKLIDKKLTIKMDAENQEWNIETEQLIQWLDPASAGWKQLDIEMWIAELAKTVDRPAQNASFRFVEGGKVEEFRPEKNGHQINQGLLLQTMLESLAVIENGNEAVAQINLPFNTTKPEVAVGEVNNLGIKSLIGKGESWFSGSITNRIFNLKKAADALNGILIPPGEEFSFNKTVGEISQATGYKSAFIIKEGKTLLGDGGGVCQTSSTLFRAVLNSGLPIDQRVAHAYRVSYYEQNYEPGFDATIFQPAPDFIFKNDTPAHILLQTKFDEANKHLVIEIYGTPDGRVATVSKARIWDVVSPPPDLYIDDPNLAVGKVVQTEHAARGSKVAFDWKVVRGDEILQERTFYSNYKPWQGVYLRGTKPL